MPFSDHTESKKEEGEIQEGTPSIQSVAFPPSADRRENGIDETKKVEDEEAEEERLRKLVDIQGSNSRSGSCSSSCSSLSDSCSLCLREKSWNGHENESVEVFSCEGTLLHQSLRIGARRPPGFSSSSLIYPAHSLSLSGSPSQSSLPPGFPLVPSNSLPLGITPIMPILPHSGLAGTEKGSDNHAAEGGVRMGRLASTPLSQGRKTFGHLLENISVNPQEAGGGERKRIRKQGHTQEGNNDQSGTVEDEIVLDVGTSPQKKKEKQIALKTKKEEEDEEEEEELPRVMSTISFSEHQHMEANVELQGPSTPLFFFPSLHASHTVMEEEGRNTAAPGGREKHAKSILSAPPFSASYRHSLSPGQEGDRCGAPSGHPPFAVSSPKSVSVSSPSSKGGMMDTAGLFPSTPIVYATSPPYSTTVLMENSGSPAAAAAAGGGRSSSSSACSVNGLGLVHRILSSPIASSSSPRTEECSSLLPSSPASSTRRAKGAMAAPHSPSVVPQCSSGVVAEDGDVCEVGRAGNHWSSTSTSNGSGADILASPSSLSSYPFVRSPTAACESPDGENPSIQEDNIFPSTCGVEDLEGSIVPEAPYLKEGEHHRCASESRMLRHTLNTTAYCLWIPYVIAALYMTYCDAFVVVGDRGQFPHLPRDRYPFWYYYFFREGFDVVLFLWKALPILWFSTIVVSLTGWLATLPGPHVPVYLVGMAWIVGVFSFYFWDTDVVHHNKTEAFLASTSPFSNHTASSSVAVVPTTATVGSAFPSSCSTGSPYHPTCASAVASSPYPAPSPLMACQANASSLSFYLFPRDTCTSSAPSNSSYYHSHPSSFSPLPNSIAAGYTNTSTRSMLKSLFASSLSSSTLSAFRSGSFSSGSGPISSSVPSTFSSSSSTTTLARSTAHSSRLPIPFVRHRPSLSSAFPISEQISSAVHSSGITAETASSTPMSCSSHMIGGNMSWNTSRGYTAYPGISSCSHSSSHATDMDTCPRVCGSIPSSCSHHFGDDCNGSGRNLVPGADRPPCVGSHVSPLAWDHSLFSHLLHEGVVRVEDNFPAPSPWMWLAVSLATGLVSGVVCKVWTRLARKNLLIERWKHLQHHHRHHHSHHHRPPPPLQKRQHCPSHQHTQGSTRGDDGEEITSAVLFPPPSNTSLFPSPVEVESNRKKKENGPPPPPEEGEGGCEGGVVDAGGGEEDGQGNQKECTCSVASSAQSGFPSVTTACDAAREQNIHHSTSCNYIVTATTSVQEAENAGDKEEKRRHLLKPLTMCPTSVNPVEDEDGGKECKAESKDIANHSEREKKSSGEKPPSVLTSSAAGIKEKATQDPLLSSTTCRVHQASGGGGGRRNNSSSGEDSGRTMSIPRSLPECSSTDPHHSSMVVSNYFYCRTPTSNKAILSHVFPVVASSQHKTLQGKKTLRPSCSVVAFPQEFPSGLPVALSGHVTQQQKGEVEKKNSTSPPRRPGASTATRGHQSSHYGESLETNSEYDSGKCKMARKAVAERYRNTEKGGGGEAGEGSSRDWLSKNGRVKHLTNNHSQGGTEVEKEGECAPLSMRSASSPVSFPPSPGVGGYFSSIPVVRRERIVIRPCIPGMKGRLFPPGEGAAPTSGIRPSRTLTLHMSLIIPFCTGQWFSLMLRYGWRGFLIQNIVMTVTLGFIGYTMICFQLLRKHLKHSTCEISDYGTIVLRHRTLPDGSIVAEEDHIIVEMLDVKVDYMHFFYRLISTKMGLVIMGMIGFHLYFTSWMVTMIQTLYTLNALVSGAGILVELLIYEMM